MKRLLLLLMMASAAFGQLAYTTVAQVLHGSAPGSFCSGSITLSNVDFYYGGQLVKAGTTSSRVINGQLSVKLVPGGYTVYYLLAPSGCSPASETWNVPYSATPIDLNAVRPANLPALPTLVPLSWLTQSGATTGQVPQWNGTVWTPATVGGTIASTTSVLKGDGAGNAVAVTGTGTDCVKVNGSSGACGSGSGTVTVVGAGTLTSTNIVTGGGSQTIQTPSSSATLDSSGNLAATTVATGASAPSLSWFTGTAGILGLHSGTNVGTVPSGAGFLADISGAPTWLDSSAARGMCLSDGTSCPSANVTVGTTTITGGTSGKVEYNNAGVLGEYALQGNGAKVQMSTGTTTTNNCVKFDANGNTVDAGSACSGGGSYSYPIFCMIGCPFGGTNPTLTSSNVYWYPIKSGTLAPGSYSQMLIPVLSGCGGNHIGAALYSRSGTTLTKLVSGATTNGAGGYQAISLSYTVPANPADYYLATATDCASYPGLANQPASAITGSSSLNIPLTSTSSGISYSGPDFAWPATISTASLTAAPLIGVTDAIWEH